MGLKIVPRRLWMILGMAPWKTRVRLVNIPAESNATYARSWRKCGWSHLQSQCYFPGSASFLKTWDCLGCHQCAYLLSIWINCFHESFEMLRLIKQFQLNQANFVDFSEVHSCILKQLGNQVFMDNGNFINVYQRNFLHFNISR